MKIKTAISDKRPVFTFTIKVWEATQWNLGGTSLSAELYQRAYAAAGLSPTNSRIIREQWLQRDEDGDYIFEVKLFRNYWEELA